MKTLPTCFLLLILSLLLLSKAHGQDRKFEIQLYAGLFSYIENVAGLDGPLEFGGPSLEYYIKENTSIGLSASLNNRRHELDESFYDPIGDNLIHYDYGVQRRNRILNFYFRKYAERNSRVTTFWGGYLRYWFYRDERIETAQYSQEHVGYLIQGREPTQYTDHKISVGYLFGMKGQLSEIAYLSIAGGFGGSLPFMYIRSEKYFNQEDDRAINFKNAEAFDTRHISLLCHLTLGFKL